MTKLKLATVKIDISKLSDPINLDLRCFNISGPAVLCDGVRQRWRPDVPDPAVREVQGASGCVSTNIDIIYKITVSSSLGFTPLK